MKGRLNILSWALAIGMSFSSCSDRMDTLTTDNGMPIDIRIATFSEIAPDNELNDIKGFLFSEGILTNTINDIKFTSGQPCSILTDYKDGDHLYLVSEANNVLVSTTDNIQEDNFIKLITAPCKDMNAPVYMSGSTVVSKSEANKITMKRGVARVDINADAGISVKKVTLGNVCDRGFVFAQDIKSTPGGGVYRM